MKVTPRTEQEIKMSKLLPDGEYDYFLIESSDKVSKSGNEMIHFVLNIEKNGKIYTIHDYLLNIDSMSFKIRHACESFGLMDKYNSGSITANDFLDKNKKGKIKVGIQHDKNGVYDSKNVVKDYIFEEKSNDVEFEDSELPF